MRRGRSALRYGLIGVGVVMGLALAAAMTLPSFVGYSLFRRHMSAHLSTTPVRRTDLSVTMTTGGRIDSSDKTLIVCELENVAMSVRGNVLGVNGSSTILTVVPDGSVVKKGDVLCALDASAYEEMVRTQTMNVERVRADFNQAKLRLEVAQMAISEYTDGIMGQARKTLDGQLALTKSDYERAVDRLAWTRRMFEKGYLAKAQLTTEEFALNRLALNLKKGKTALDLFERFSAPKYVFILKTDVLAAEALYNYQLRRLRFSEEQLALYKKQVDRCTIRAPHDGFVIHANEEMRNVHIEAGMAVHQKQRLFYLPNLAQMEVAAMLHESVVKDVKPGMLARVKVEALPNRVLEGHIDAITQIPQTNFFSDVKYFYGTVKLHNVPTGLKPGMSAEVEIVTANKPDVLVIPTEALTVEAGQDVCYVTHDDALVRREVKVGQTSRDYLEVVEGLDEGDEVVLEPEAAVSAVVVADVDPPVEAPRPGVSDAPAKTGE